jgi:cell division protein FtsL
MARKEEIRYIQFYTDGSAAKQITPRWPVAAPKKKSAQKKKQIVYVDPLALGGIVVAVVMLALMIVGVCKLNAVQQEATQMQTYVETLKAENVTLKQRYSEECDLEAIEQTALALGMIPVEEAQQIQITVQLPHEETEPSFWDNIGVFLTGLFA